MALSATMNIMIKAAEKAGRNLVRDFGEVEQLQVSRKGPGDFVSAADLRAEEIIHDSLKKARPDYDFLMEEGGAKKAGATDSEFRWIIDPLDGTFNFLHGVPHWCISIGLEQKGEIVAGIVYDPVKDETFRAEKGQGAFQRHKRLRVSGRTSLESAIVAVGRPQHHSQEEIDRFTAEYSSLLTAVREPRRMGAAALDLCYVAAGRFEAYFERGVKAWDVAAGHLIVREAGGIISALDRKDDPIHGGIVLASNGAVHEDIRSLIQKANKQRNAA
jgi:myo-inositol-1(or 4)-monophosphatase